MQFAPIKPGQPERKQQQQQQQQQQQRRRQPAHGARARAAAPPPAAAARHLVAPFGGGSQRFGIDGIYARRPVDASYDTAWHGSIESKVARARERARAYEDLGAYRAQLPEPGAVPGMPVFGPVSARGVAAGPAITAPRWHRSRSVFAADPFVIELEPATGPAIGPGSYTPDGGSGAAGGSPRVRDPQRPSSAFASLPRVRPRPRSAVVIEARRSAGKRAWIPSIRPADAPENNQLAAGSG
jgi:hypothetical protein